MGSVEDALEELWNGPTELFEELLIVEIEAIDGKNIFYLPKKSQYTAIMSVTENDPVKAKEKSRLNEQLILECIGKANR